MRTLDFSEAELLEMEALYKKGWSTGRIAERYGCLMGSVWRRLKDRGVKMRSPATRRRTAYVASHGYVMWGQSYVHRIVAQAWLGRPLRDGEVVHHKNGDKLDNRPENLEVFPSNAEHMRSEHVNGWCRDELDRLVQMRLAGFTLAQMAEEFGRSSNGIRKQIRKLKKSGRIPNRDERHKWDDDREAA